MSAIRKLVFCLIVASLVSGCAKFWGGNSGAGDEEQTAEQFYAEAKQALDKKRFQEAIELYQKLEARYPYGPYAEQAQLEVAYAYHKNDEPDAAIAAADRFIRLHPTHPNVPYAFYIKGLVNFNQQQSVIDRLTGGEVSDRDPRAARESYAAFRELVKRYPESRYAEDARQRMEYLLNALAEHDVHVADYYLRRAAYVAVVNRCKHIIEHYERTPAVEDALGLMAIAYQRMGMEELAQDTLRVLQMNFPASAYFESYEKAAQKRRFSLIPKFLRGDKDG